MFCSPLASISYRVHIPLLEDNASNWKTRWIKACMYPSSRLNAVWMISNKGKCYPGKWNSCGQTHLFHVSKVPMPTDLACLKWSRGKKKKKENQQGQLYLPVKILHGDLRRVEGSGKVEKAKVILWKISHWIYPPEVADICSLLPLTPLLTHIPPHCSRKRFGVLSASPTLSSHYTPSGCVAWTTCSSKACSPGRHRHRQGLFLPASHSPLFHY